MTHEELFNHCLSELESSDSVGSPILLDGAFSPGQRAPRTIPNSIFHLTNPPEKPFLLAQMCINCTRFDVIKVMKSGIFHKGGLKGSRSVVYFFKDLVSFILRATSYIIEEKPDEYLRYYTSAFDRAINQIERLKFIASYYHSKRSCNNLTKIKANLEKIKSDLLSGPVIALPPHKGGDSINLLIRVFKQQLPPGTHETTISEAISTLLKAFNMYAEPEAIRQRMTRAKKK